MRQADAGGATGMSKGKLTTIPFGPQHPVLPEAVQLQFFVDEEKIVDLSLIHI